MNRLNRLHAVQQEVCSTIWGQQLRRRGHQTESSSVLQEDRIYPSIGVVAPKRTNASPYNRPSAPICPGPFRFSPVSPSCTFPRASPPPLPLATRPHHLLLQTVHPHTCPKNKIFCYVDMTGLLAVIPIALHWVFNSSLFE